MKKYLKQILITKIIDGKTEIVPDLTINYHLKIILKNDINNIGYFDSYILDDYTSENNIENGSDVIISGGCTTRLKELGKYKSSELFPEKYIPNGNYDVDGVDYGASTNVLINYYIGGIKYIDRVINGITYTTFTFLSRGYDPNLYINTVYYKDFTKGDIVSRPKIVNDISIKRQEISAFEKNYIFENMTSINDIETFGAGNFFNIINNI